MRLTFLGFSGFRNLSDGELLPDPGVNVVFGENAQGKTNLLEAIWTFSGCRSFRGAKDQETIAFGREFAKLKAKFETESREHKASVTLADKKSVTLDGVKLKSAAGLLGKFSAVVFSPAFLSIVKSGPEERRRFLDASLCQIRPAYAAVCASYARLLRQRNTLLKDVFVEPSLFDMLDVLDQQTAEAGEEMERQRRLYLGELLPKADDIYEGLSGGRETLSLQYISRREETGKTLLEALRDARKEDLQTKTTSVGPHRDDLEILLDGKSARAFGSQGQQRSAALALKFGESEILKDRLGEQPVILLDDVMSELDHLRQDFILNHIKDRQVFITCCEPQSVRRLAGGKKFEVREGRITPCT